MTTTGGPVSYYQNSLRSCVACSAHILVTDGRSRNVYCQKCQAKRPSADSWAASLKKGDLVYVQPTALPWPALSRSEWLIVSRDGDTFDLKLRGSDKFNFTTTLGQLASEDMTPRTRFDF